MTGHIFIGVLILLITTPVFGQTQNRPIAAIGPILSGQVVDHEGRGIVADIHFSQLRRDFRASSHRTDANGWFEVAGWVDIPVEVRVTANGYTTEQLRVDSPATWPPLVIRLKRSAVVVGAVRDRTGFGIADARVIVDEAPGKTKFNRRVSDHYVLTDDIGRFMVQVPAGRSFRLRIEKSDCSVANTLYMTLAETQNAVLDASIIECR